MTTNHGERPGMTVRARDWRRDYLICEHVAADEGFGVARERFRVCCSECAIAGLLTADVQTEKRGELTIMRAREVAR